MIEPWLALLSGLFFSAGIYLLLAPHLLRALIGFALFGNAINLLLFLSGRVTRDAPPIIGEAQTALKAGVANPLPQALILTAIVISFSFFAFLLVLAWRAFRDLGAEEVDGLDRAEPRDRPAPPGGY